MVLSTLITALCPFLALLLLPSRTHFGSLYYGWPGGIGGFIFGPVAYIAVVLVLLGIRDLLRRDWPPPCADGKCRGGFWHNEIIVLQDIADRKFHIVHRCRCWHYYEEIRRRFMERLPDGTLRPCMVYRPYQGWFPDPEAANSTEGQQ